MTERRPVRLPPRGNAPELAPPVSGSTDVLRVVRLRQHRRAASICVSVVAIVVLGMTLGSTTRGDNTLQPVTPPERSTERIDEDAMEPAPGAGHTSASTASTAPGSGPTEPGRVPAAAPAQGPDGVRPRQSASVTRTKSRSDLPRGCGPVAEWCLAADVTPATGGGYAIASTMCLSTKAIAGELTFATTHEADFELLAGSRVIWRWSDTQAVREAGAPALCDRR